MITMNVKPRISREFEESIKAHAESGTYRVDFKRIEIDVFPWVFPPQSPFSESTHAVYDQFTDLTGQAVLDVGTGTGIQAIQAALAGADAVHAIDVDWTAVACAKHNVRLNNLENKILVWQSDLFSNVCQQYDLIVANLPIVDVDDSDPRFTSLYDPDFILHKGFFSSAADYLACGGRMRLCHADLQDGAFEKLEQLATEYCFSYKVLQSTNALGHEWRSYEFQCS
jgi:release factor glutamine methyltransferase